MLLNTNLPVFLLFELISMTYQSITGVTYMDDFDFEERYEDVNECNPIYWNPLHLPQKCMKMFQKIIRSKLASQFNSPMRIIKERENMFYTRPRNRYSKYESMDSDMVMSSDDDFDYVPNDRFLSDRYIKSLPPNERMLALLKRDVYRNPTAPIVGMVPNFGPVAIYQQMVSKQSEIMIKAMAKMYADANKKPRGRSEGYLRAYKQGANGTIIKVKDSNINGPR